MKLLVSFQLLVLVSTSSGAAVPQQPIGLRKLSHNRFNFTSYSSGICDYAVTPNVSLPLKSDMETERAIQAAFVESIQRALHVKWGIFGPGRFSKDDDGLLVHRDVRIKLGGIGEGQMIAEILEKMKGQVIGSEISGWAIESINCTDLGLSTQDKCRNSTIVL